LKRNLGNARQLFRGSKLKAIYSESIKTGITSFRSHYVEQ